MNLCRFLLAPLVVAASLLAPLPSWGATEAQTPDDICPPDADPCIVDKPYKLTGFELDFGVRELRIVKGGNLIPDTFYFDIYCGAFVLEERGKLAPRIRTGFFHGTGVELTIYVRGTCSDEPLTACQADYDCTSGECIGGDATLAGTVRGASLFPGGLAVLASGNIVSTARMNLSRAGGEVASGGGFVQLYARGTLDVTGSLRSRGGGAVHLFGKEAARAIDMEVNVGGGPYSHGSVLVQSDFDATASGEFLTMPEGSFALIAGRDALLTTQSDGSETTLNLDAGTLSEGDAGSIGIVAGRDATVDQGVLMSLTGWDYGGSISMTAQRDATFSTIAHGTGGFYMRAYDGAVSFPGNAHVELAGTDNEWPDVDLKAGTTLDFAGTIEAIGETYTGFIRLEADSMTVSGRISQYGAPTFVPESPTIRFLGCDLDFTPTSVITSAAESMRIGIETGTVSIAAGAAMTATPSGAVEIVYSDSLQPPSVLGDVSPSPEISYLEYAGTCAF